MTVLLSSLCESVDNADSEVVSHFNSTRVSNELGAGSIDKAKKAVKVTLMLSILLGVTFLLLLGLGHNLWAGLFSNSETVISAFASMTPLLIGSVVLDSTQGVLSG
jgi:MATE family multidrug resistance protein